jgi:hypothetical protein
MADASVDRGLKHHSPLLVFVHIPKTAGTTLRMILSLNEPGERTRRIGNVFKGGGGVKQGVTFEGVRKDDGAGLREVRILTGHIPLGVRGYFSQGRDVRCFTFLREPTDRTLSHYFQIRESANRDRANRRDRSKQRTLGLPPLPSEPTLEDMLEGGYIHDNLHTRMLSGLPEPFDAVTEEMLEQAKRNLREELVFFGLTERFDESLVLAKQRLGLRSILYGPTGKGASSGRVSASRPRGEQVPEELAAAAERCNRYDIELYRYAEELFDGAPELRELDFQVELAALRLARDEGEAGLDLPAPAGFGGDEEAWRMLVAAKASSLRQEHELAELKALAHERARRDREIMDGLERITASGKSKSGRDAATARRVIEMMTPVQAMAIDDGTLELNAAGGIQTPAGERAAPAGAAAAKRRRGGRSRKAARRKAKPEPRAGARKDRRRRHG